MNAIQLPGLTNPVVFDAGGTLRLVRRLSVFCGVAVSAVILPLVAYPAAPLVAELRSSGLAGIAAGSLLLALTGLLATLLMTWARCHAGRGPYAAQRLARMGRRPQGSIVPLLGFTAATAAWWLRPAVAGAALPNAVLLGSCAIVLSFPLLVAERIIAGVRPSRLPEAPGLQALLFVPVIAIPAAGALEIAAGLGAWWARLAMAAIDVFLCIAAAELGVRSLANWFLPPPSPAAARAAIDSLAALALQPGRWKDGGIAAPLRTHLGLDFSRSLALRYLRSAALPVALLIVLAAWGLSGVALINLDQRGIYERSGAPIAVWQPGAHAGLPWPLGRVQLVDLGIVHSVALGTEDRAAAPATEDLAPAGADRLWDRPHPAEVSYLIASVDSSGAQSFQSVNVDLRVLYRTGLDDAAALRAAYAVAAPAELVRAGAGRLLARFFAGQTLDAVLGDNREALAETLRATLQADLDRQDSGIQLAGLVIEAIHPPPEAAEAYHNVQAAEIVANTAVATERGRAQATAAMARQIATGLANGARGTAAETIAQAATLSRSFAADRDAALAGGHAFLLERYFTNVSLALAKSPLVIVDHRLGGADAPTVDLRSFGAPTGRPGEDD